MEVVVEEQEAVAEALQQDSEDLLPEQASDGLKGEHNPSDHGQACTDGKGAPGNRGDRTGFIDPPAYAEVTPQFGHLERIMVASSNTDGRHPYQLRKARMAVIKAHASTPSNRTDKRSYTESRV